MNVIDAAISVFMDERIFQIFQNQKQEDIDKNCLNFSKNYYEYLKNSMQSLKFEEEEILEFERVWMSYQKWLDLFFKANSIEEAIRVKLQIVRECRKLKHQENRVREKFVKDWEKNLTKAIPGDYQQFAILVQTLSFDDFRNPGRGQAIACSLFTDKFQKLYLDRYLGYVYDLRHKDLILASTTDANTNFSDPIDFKAKYESVIGAAVGNWNLYGEAFYSFQDFVDRCSPNQFSEVVFNRSSWAGQKPCGVFIKEGISDRGRQLAQLAAELREIPLYEYRNNILKIFPMNFV